MNCEPLILEKETTCRIWSGRRQRPVTKRVRYLVERRPGLRLITIQEIEEHPADQPGTRIRTRTDKGEFALVPLES